VEVKRAFIDWVGPIVHEYYSGSEGVGFSIIGPEEWLAHPGSVGRPIVGVPHILDSLGDELPHRQEGQIWFEGAPRFEYHGDREKTRSAFNDRGWASLGDMGWVDDEGYLYLTDRVSNMVISGGVNIYPREIEDVFALHPQVADVAVIGVAHPDFGEAVRAVIQPAVPVTDAHDFAAELLAYCREQLSRFKCPTSFALIDAVPRLPTGKLAKRMLPEWVREPFPEGQLAACAPTAESGGDD
jgi:acyl-CoA synthetase (AMP-forming)/AMP-acid ligase II